MRDVTISDGMSMPGWFDIEGLKVSEMRADSEGIQQSIDHVKKVIDEEIASGTPSDRIVLAGFSQGGVIALGAAMQAEHCLGGVMALSTWFPRGIADTPEKVDDPKQLGPTLFLVLFTWPCIITVGTYKGHQWLRIKKNIIPKRSLQHFLQPEILNP